MYHQTPSDTLSDPILDPIKVLGFLQDLRVGTVFRMTLVEELAGELRKNGSVQRIIEDDEVAVEWRKAARAAARSLGRPVETLRSGRVTVAALRDWPANELEEQLHAARLRRVMDAMSLKLPVES